MTPAEAPRWSLVALDIDGTIVDDDGNLTAPVRAAIAGVVAAGVPLVLATGKSAYATHSVVAQLGLPRSYCIASNGAAITQFPPIRIVELATFDARAPIEDALRRMPRARLAVEVVGEGYRVSEPFPTNLRASLARQLSIEPVQRLLAEPVTRALVYDPDGPAPQEFIEFAPPGVSKATALTRLAGLLGVPQNQVLVIGDGPNDIGMLRWAGRGVAMADAPEQVRAAADFVTGSLAEDGAATELGRWFEPVDGTLLESG